MRLGDEARAPMEVIPTGAIALDVALGIGGLPAAGSLRSTDPKGAGNPPWPCMRWLAKLYCLVRLRYRQVAPRRVSPKSTGAGGWTEVGRSRLTMATRRPDRIAGAGFATAQRQDSQSLPTREVCRLPGAGRRSWSARAISAAWIGQETTSDTPARASVMASNASFDDVASRIADRDIRRAARWSIPARLSVTMHILPPPRRTAPAMPDTRRTHPQAREPDGFVAQCRKQFFVPQQAVGSPFPAPARSRRPQRRKPWLCVGGAWCGGIDTGQPDFKPAAIGRRTFHMHGAAMVAHDFLRGCQAKAGRRLHAW